MTLNLHRSWTQILTVKYSFGIITVVATLLLFWPSARGQRFSLNRQALTCLPTGVCLDAAGRSFDVGNMPLAMLLSPEGDRLIISLSGWREQGLEVVDWKTGQVVQRIPQASAFLGLVFSSDGKTLFASGGNEDAVFRYAWRDKQASLVGKIVLAPKEAKKDGTRFPAGLALSPDGHKLFVAENLADCVAVVDVETNKIDKRLPTDAY